MSHECRTTYAGVKTVVQHMGKFLSDPTKHPIILDDKIESRVFLPVPLKRWVCPVFEGVQENRYLQVPYCGSTAT